MRGYLVRKTMRCVAPKHRRRQPPPPVLHDPDKLTVPAQHSDKVRAQHPDKVRAKHPDNKKDFCQESPCLSVHHQRRCASPWVSTSITSETPLVYGAAQKIQVSRGIRYIYIYR